MLHRTGVCIPVGVMSDASSLSSKIANKIDRIRHLNEKRRRWLKPLSNLFRDQASINQTVVECIEAQNRAITALASPPVVKAKYRPKMTYDGDNIITYGRSVEWKEDPSFQAAYHAGMATATKIRSPDATGDFIEWRAHIAIWAARHGAHLEGDFVECGVNTGIMSLAICYTLQFASLPKRFWLFDTYCGIPLEQALPTELEKASAHSALYYEDCYELAKKNFSPYPNAVLVKGLVPDTLPQCTAEKIAYLSIDMNIAAPERASLDYFWPKLVSGAMVLLDDYGFLGHEEQRRSLNEFAAQNNVAIATLPTGQGLLIKP